MNDTELIAERFAADKDVAARKAPGLFRRLRSEPLLPDAGSGGAPLTAVIAVMAFLATLALASAILIASAANAWTGDLESALTVQIKGADASVIASQTETALEILRSTQGVIETRALTPEESAALLEPWLGKGNVGAYLNIPAIIEVQIAPELRGDLDLLRNRLAAAAPGAELDDHSNWHRPLASAARSGQALAFAVFLLVMGAAVAISMFAARAGLAANNDIVSLLHLVGATDAFIAAQVQRRFLVLGIRGSLGGFLGAILVLGLLALATKAGGGQFFLPTFDLGPRLALVLFIVPAALCLVTAMTARMTVLKTLAREL